MIKYLLFTLCLGFSMLVTQAQTKERKADSPDKNKPIIIAEAACGECKFGLHGTSCDLAIRMNGKSYFVDGTDIDSHGDAHAKDGFCKAIRKAEVQGEFKGDRFLVSYFKLLPDETKMEKKRK